MFKIKILKDHPSAKVEGFDETAKVEQMTIAQWYEEYFLDGIYYDPRYDRRILWSQIDIEKYYLSLVQNMAIQPYWYGNVERSTGFQPATENNDALTSKYECIIKECMEHYQQLYQHRIRIV